MGLRSGHMQDSLSHGGSQRSNGKRVWSVEPSLAGVLQCRDPEGCLHARVCLWDASLCPVCALCLPCTCRPPSPPLFSQLLPPRLFLVTLSEPKYTEFFIICASFFFNLNIIPGRLCFSREKGSISAVGRFLWRNQASEKGTDEVPRVGQTRMPFSCRYSL